MRLQISNSVRGLENVLHKPAIRYLKISGHQDRDHGSTQTGERWSVFRGGFLNAVLVTKYQPRDGTNRRVWTMAKD